MIFSENLFPLIRIMLLKGETARQLNRECGVYRDTLPVWQSVRG
jgi:hypothetical protein